MEPAMERSARPHTVSNGINGPGQSQSSIRAAQVVSSLSTTTGQLGDDDRQSFEQLLSEMLNASNESSGDGSFTEADFQTNYNLVSVVTKAGLDILLEDNPFANVDHLLSVADGSLTVLASIFHRHPDLLFHDRANGNATNVAQPPMYAWLLPRLLVLIGKRRFESLQDGLEGLLRSILRAATRATRSSVISRKLLDYYQTCIKGLLGALEDDSFVTSPAFEAMIPPESILLEHYPGALSGALRSTLVAVRDSSQVCMIVLSLLSAIVSTVAQDATLDSVLEMKSYLPWAFDGLAGLCRTVSSLEQNPKFACPRSGVTAIIVRLFTGVFDSVSASDLRPGVLRKALTALVRWEAVLLRWSAEDQSVALQNVLSITLTTTCRIVQNFGFYIAEVDSVLMPAICVVQKQDRPLPLSRELEVALLRVLRLGSPSNNALPVMKDLASRLDDHRTPDEVAEVSGSFQELHVDEEQNVEAESSRPTKRRRITQPDGTPNSQTLKARLIGDVYGLLGSQPAEDLDGLRNLAEHGFTRLSDFARCKALEDMGLLACAAADTLKLDEEENRSFQLMSCSTCDDEISPGPVAATMETSERDKILMAFETLIKSPEMQNSRKPRVWAMLALGRVIRHSGDGKHLELSSSTFGGWCLQSCRSSLRELRLAAGQVLPNFLTASGNTKTLAKNRAIVFDFLRRLSDTAQSDLQESCVRAWSQVARVCTDEELSLVLLRLVQYLGHTNSLVHGVAFEEIFRLAEYKELPLVRLMTPYWRLIAIAVVKDLHVRPQTVQLLSEMLGMSVDEFLVLTQAFTISHLVLDKKHDILRRIALARGDGNKLWYDKENISSTVAFLFLQESLDIQAILDILRQASDRFEHVTPTDLVEIELISTSCELLKTAGDLDDNNRSKVPQAIARFAALYVQSRAQEKRTKSTNIVGEFFEKNVLGLITQFSDTINGLQWRPDLEKRRCLRGIEAMIRLGRRHVSDALPQIGACLQSAFEMDTLRDEATSAWITMMMTLDDEDLEMMIENAFAIMALNWDLLQPLARERMKEMMDHLLQDHTAIIRKKICLLPSLATIPELARYQALLNTMRDETDIRERLQVFSERCQHEHISVVVQALKELSSFLRENQSFVHLSAASEQPDAAISKCIRSLLDACVRFAGKHSDVANLCAQCIGLVGCLDPNSIDASRADQDILVRSNFDNAEEAMDWVMSFLHEILFKAFISATIPRAQGFIGYAMQEFLKFCGLDSTVILQGKGLHTNDSYRRWIRLPYPVRNSLTPFLSSKYFVPAGLSNARCVYPILPSYPTFSSWLRTFVMDLLQKGRGENAPEIFAVCSRVVRNQDVSIAEFLIPFVALNVVVGGGDTQVKEVGQELLEVLKHEVDGEKQEEKEHLRLCSDTVFRILDYFSKWMQEKKKQIAYSRYPSAGPVSRTHSQAQHAADEFKIHRVEYVLRMVPAEVISRRAMECKSFSRALFHWERYIRQERLASKSPPRTCSTEALYERLQEIYTQIDEPDGIDGISVYLRALNIDQQVLEHRKAGRWMAAQSWFELQLAERPDDLDVQVNLLTCLKESGQHDVLLNHVEGLHRPQSLKTKLLPFVTEAAWATARWNILEKYVGCANAGLSADFNVNIGHILLALYKKDSAQFTSLVLNLRESIAKGLSRATTASLQSCHEDLLKLHVLNEVELISGMSTSSPSRETILRTLDHRLPVLGSYLLDKQYILTLRRAAMQLSCVEFQKEDIASAWLTSARLARKGKFIHQSFNAAIHASQLGAESAKIEHARLLWSESHHRKAIQTLEGAIATNAFQSHNSPSAEDSVANLDARQDVQQNILMARAHLLLAKWLDSAGQTRSHRVGAKYQDASRAHIKWEKGHYYLGRHYNKLYESEKTLPPHRQSSAFITGETGRLVCQNYLRSVFWGTKYVYQTVPRALTLWLDLGSQVGPSVDPKPPQSDRMTLTEARTKNLEIIHKAIDKVLEKGPQYVFYTALAQLLARICHPNQDVLNVIQKTIVRAVSRQLPQALWSILAVTKSSSRERVQRAKECILKIREVVKRSKSTSPAIDVRNLINQGQKLIEQLLNVCNGELHGRPSIVSASRDLGFSHKCTPCQLVVPLESTLFATLPRNPDAERNFQLFSSQPVTVSAVLDEVTILHSLQRPRKISVRGSDGGVYGLLCKPKDDLRKDQRLMEFNAMINRSLKRDADSSKRRLYIKTYAVTPLNEECGLIEWVDNLRAFRDIVIHLYRAKGVVTNFAEIRSLLDEATSHPSKLHIFEDRVLSVFPPVFHDWFVEMFPEPGAWFAARLKYTRSCAVMSMVGMVLGLGDRHGENILFEEGNGGTFHVDFNCLFDKGLTFEKPERVPFRLTQNMVDAFGVYGYEGPFRKSCELTLDVLRQNEEALLTILETFVYDPTTDFIGKKKKSVKHVPETPQDVLDSVRGKVQGLLPGETVPLSVEGHVDELIQQAVSHHNLASMYIGWCAFW